MQKFYSNGKLLITGEYLVLDGAKALAIPTKFGQDLIINEIDQPKLIWESYDEKGEAWFKSEFELNKLEILDSDKDFKTTKMLQKILKETQKLNPEFLDIESGFHVKTNLTFPRNWGLGSSSTLINNIANWAKINAYELLNNSFGGSGYDIACAESNSPVLYQLLDQKPIIEKVNFNPDFNDQLYFVHLNKKQNSREGIANYREFTGNISAVAEEISQLTKEILKAKKLEDFERMIEHHEIIIASILKQDPVQEKLFSDYFGQTKSLGAWGGDFILATGNKDTPKYFKEKGFETVLSYREMILSSNE
ncbi:MAG: GYDIA family GHMP kinase, partial [Bacteroidota bacterium]